MITIKFSWVIGEGLGGRDLSVYFSICESSLTNFWIKGTKNTKRCCQFLLFVTFCLLVSCNDCMQKEIHFLFFRGWKEIDVYVLHVNIWIDQNNYFVRIFNRITGIHVANITLIIVNKWHFGYHIKIQTFLIKRQLSFD